jgi:glutamyl/glutaminyl-tRNA synthetase
VVNAIYVWGYGRSVGARVRLRIEDHDRVRSHLAFEYALLEDLAWLGFVADEPAVRQSDRTALYDEALAQLRRTHHVYACDCSRKDVGGERYAGRCQSRQLAEGPGRGLRIQLMPGVVERFDDVRLGTQEQTPAEQCGDLLIRDRDGNWTYQFAVTVDDWLQDITLIIRGEDLLASTGRQLQLARMLGRAGAPRFLHHPLIVKSSGEKLSKAAADSGVRELRAHGLGADDVIGRAAAAVGLIPQEMPVAASAVEQLFR